MELVLINECKMRYVYQRNVISDGFNNSITVVLILAPCRTDLAASSFGDSMLPDSITHS